MALFATMLSEPFRNVTSSGVRGAFTTCTGSLLVVYVAATRAARFAGAFATAESSVALAPPITLIITVRPDGNIWYDRALLRSTTNRVTGGLDW